MTLESELRGLRRRLALVSAAEGALRGGAFAAAACFLLLVASFFAAFTVSAWMVAGVVLASALAGALARRLPDLAETARRLDRRLGLDDRLATALEARGPFAELQRNDARRALAGADARRVARFALSTEAKVLPLMFALCAGALMAQSIRGADDAPARAPTPQHMEAIGWVSLAADVDHPLADRLAAAAAEIADGAVPIAELDAIAQEAADRLREGDLSAEEVRALKQIGRAARGAAAALGRTADGEPARLWDLGAPDDPALEAAFGTAPHRGTADMSGTGPVTAGSSGRPWFESAEGAGAARRWDAKYDAMIRNYFSE